MLWSRCFSCRTHSPRCSRDWIGETQTQKTGYRRRTTFCFNFCVFFTSDSRQKELSAWVTTTAPIPVSFRRWKISLTSSESTAFWWRQRAILGRTCFISHRPVGLFLDQAFMIQDYDTVMIILIYCVALTQDGTHLYSCYTSPRCSLKFRGRIWIKFKISSRPWLATRSYTSTCPF